MPKRPFAVYNRRTGQTVCERVTTHTEKQAIGFYTAKILGQPWRTKEFGATDLWALADKVTAFEAATLNSGRD